MEDQQKDLGGEEVAKGASSPVTSASPIVPESVSSVPVVEEIPASEAIPSSTTSIPSSPSSSSVPTETEAPAPDTSSAPTPASVPTPSPAKKSTSFVDLYNGAKKLFNAQKYEEALVQFNKAIEASPANNSQMKTLIYSRASCLKKLVVLIFNNDG